MIAQIDPLYIKTRPTKVLTRLMSYAFFEGAPRNHKGALDKSARFLFFEEISHEQ